MKWQPIQTAPKDGTFIIAVWGGYECPLTSHEDTFPGIAWFHQGEWHTRDYGASICPEPLYWIPFPNIPE